MSKKSSVIRNDKRKRLSKSHQNKRDALKEIVMNRDLPLDERFRANLKLAQMPRNGAKTRVRLRCALTGRPRGNYRKLQLSRIALRELASAGKIAGMIKSSW